MASAIAELIINATANTGEAQSDLKGMAATLDTVGAAAGIVAAAIAAAGYTLVNFAAQADEQQRQMQRLAFALDAAGLSADVASERLEGMFTAMSRISGISDEELREATTQFTTFAAAVGASTAEIESASVLIVDIAAQTGKSAARISRQVADAFAGNAEALAAISPALRTAGEEIATVENAAERGRLAMDLLTEQFGGAAIAAAGAGVNMRVLSNEIGDLQQSIGDQVLASGEFQDALSRLLGTLRKVDSQVQDTNSNISRAIENTGIVFEGFAAALDYVTDIGTNTYNFFVDFAEFIITGAWAQISVAIDAVVTPFQALYDLVRGDFSGALEEITSGWAHFGDAISETIGAYDRFIESNKALLYSIVGLEYAPTVVNEIGESVSAADATVRDSGETWQWLGDQIETALAVGQRMIPDIERQAAELFGSLRDFAFEGGETPQRRAATADTGPTAEDEAVKAKDTATILQQIQMDAAAAEIAAAQQKEAELLRIAKDAEIERTEFERTAAEQRAELAISLAQKVRDAEVAAAQESLAEAQRTAQLRATIAAQAAGVVVSSLDAIAAGEEKSGKERRKALGTTLAATGRGYILQAIPEFFLNPVRAAGLAAGGAGLVGFGAALGGRVFGGGGGGGGGGFSSAAPDTGLNVPTAAVQAVPQIQNDLRGVTIITDDPDTMRRIVERGDTARAAGLGGAL